MSSSAPAYPSPVSFLPVLQPISGDPLPPSPPGSHPLRLITKTWQNTKDPDTKNLSKLLYTTLTYLGMAAEQCLGHRGTASLWYLLKEELRSSQWCPGSSHCCTHRDFGSSRAPRAPPPSTDSGTTPHLCDLLQRRRLVWGRERKG